jgi:hypothetical protein
MKHARTVAMSRDAPVATAARLQRKETVKTLSYFLLPALAVFLTGCASTSQPNNLAPVGPAPFAYPRSTSQGELLVYSALNTGVATDQNATTHHSDYWIELPDGHRFKYVNNSVSTFSADPQAVALAPGRYNVSARAVNSGMVKVPVLIEAGKTTAVHLDGSKPATSSKEPSESDWVRLPNGLLLGWRAVGGNEP